MTAVDADLGQRVEHVISWAEQAARTRHRLTEPTKVQPDDVTFGGEGQPEWVPHPAIGDAGMDEDHWQVTAGARTVVGDTGGRV